METVTTSNEIIFTLPQCENAGEKEKSSFWKELRRFYRTGACADELKAKGLTSVFNSHFIISDSAPISPLILLQDQLSSHFKLVTHEFIAQVEGLMAQLDRLYSSATEKSAADEMHSAYNFADKMIAFDRLSAVLPEGRKIDLPEARVRRLAEILEALGKGLTQQLSIEGAIIICTKIAKEQEAGSVLTKAELIPAKDDIFRQAQQVFRDKAKLFLEFIKAWRMAILEADDSYNPEIHDDYFNHFSWHQLKKQELTLFPPVVVITGYQRAVSQIGSLVQLLSTGVPVKLMVLRDDLVSQPHEDIAWEDAARFFREELTAQALAHRNVYAFQGHMDDADTVKSRLAAALDTSLPAIGQILYSNRDERPHLSAATAGRFFASLYYQPMNRQNGQWIGIDSNEQPDRDWPEYEIQTKKGTSAPLAKAEKFTYADYKALFEEKAAELMVIPERYVEDQTVPLSQYLEMDEEALYGKIPFIWMADQNRQLVRCAVPNVWVVSCKERLDYWNFLQQLAHREKAQSDIVNTDQEPVKADKIQLPDDSSIQIAAERIIGGLLAIGK